MDDKLLTELQAKVQLATDLKGRVEALDRVIASCNAEVGFMDIVLNYNNQNEMHVKNILGPGDTFVEFKDVIKQGAMAVRDKLEQQYKDLK